ncbi:hypothetical protein ACQ4PT_021625 [Festuca glaucescens]
MSWLSNDFEAAFERFDEDSEEELKRAAFKFGADENAKVAACGQAAPRRRGKRRSTGMCDTGGGASRRPRSATLLRGSGSGSAHSPPLRPSHIVITTSPLFDLERRRRGLARRHPAGWVGGEIIWYEIAGRPLLRLDCCILRRRAAPSPFCGLLSPWISSGVAVKRFVRGSDLF